MHDRVSSCTPFIARSVALLVFVMIAAAGCEDSNGMVHGGGVFVPTAVPVAGSSTMLIAQPATVFPTFLSNPGCANSLPFNLNVTVVVRDGEDVTVRFTSFDLIDRFGVHTFPTSISTGIAPPIPLPTSHPIPFPGGTRTMPLSVQFACGVIPAGSLVIGTETTDSTGAVRASRLSVRIGA